MKAGLSENDQPWRLAVYPSLPSTSSLCCARAAAGEPAGLAVLAHRQTAGRGSRGRVWFSPLGSLSLSALLRPDAPAATVAQWPLLAGVAMAEGLGRFLPEPSALVLKWPNDLLLGGKKLGGILVESAADPRGRIEWVVIGFGANLGAAPELSGQPAAALADAARPPAPEDAASAILECLARWYSRWLSEGFAPVRNAWLRRAHPIGTALCLRLPREHIAGRFAGLGEDGALLLRTGDGVRSWSAGEVLLGAPGRGEPLVDRPGAPN